MPFRIGWGILPFLACACSHVRGGGSASVAERPGSRPSTASSFAAPPPAPAPTVELSPGSFQIADLSPANGGSRYIASTREVPPICQFEILIEPATSAGGGPFSFSKAALVRRRKSDCTALLRTLARELAFTGELPGPQPVDRLSVSIAILGTNQSRSPDVGEIAGSFSSTPPGHWTASKLFLADGEGEVFLNIDAPDRVGEFSIKDEDYATVVVTEFARIMLPTAG